MRYPFGREGLLSQLVWPELENEAWKDTGSPKRVLWYFLNKGVNRKLPSQAAWPKLENETWTGPGSPTPPRSGLDLSHVTFASGAETLFLSQVIFSCDAITLYLSHMHHHKMSSFPHFRLENKHRRNPTEPLRDRVP